MLKPLHDNVILKKEKGEKEKKTASGIILGDNSKNVPSYATVVAIGPDSKASITVKDKVVFKEYSGTNVKLDDEDEYIIIQDEDILAVIA